MGPQRLRETNSGGALTLTQWGGRNPEGKYDKNIKSELLLLSLFFMIQNLGFGQCI